MINPIVLIGEPLFFKKGIKVYPPTVKQVVANPNFNLFYKILTMTEDDIKDEIGDKLKDELPPEPFEYLLLNCQYVKGFEAVAIEAFQMFCHEKVSLDYQQMLIWFDNEEVALAKDDYFDFQNVVRTSLGDKKIKPPEPIDPNEDPRVRRIKELARKRDRIKAKQSGKNGISTSTCLTAICCMGIGITPLNIGEMSYASIGALMRMMQDKEKYDIDIRSLLAGASSKKVKPKYWIRNTND